MKSSTDSRSAVVSYKRNVHGVLGRLTTKQTKLITYKQIYFSNKCAQLHSETTGLNNGLSLHQLLYFVYVSSQCSDKTARHGCAGLSEPWLLANVIGTNISCTDPFTEN